MKSILILCIILSYNLKAQIQFVSASGNYKYTIPNGWKKATKKELVEFAKNSGQTYDAILYPISKSNYDGPPILLSIFKPKEFNPSEYEPFAKDLLKNLKTDFSQYLPAKYADIVKNMKPGHAFYDKKSSCFSYSYDSEIIGVAKTFNIITGFFTPKGIIILQYSAYSKNYTNTIDSYIKLVSSLKK